MGCIWKSRTGTFEKHESKLVVLWTTIQSYRQAVVSERVQKLIDSQVQLLQERITEGRIRISGRFPREQDCNGRDKNE